MSERGESAKNRTETEIALGHLFWFFENVPVLENGSGRKRLEFPPGWFGDSYIEISKEDANTFAVKTADGLGYGLAFGLDREGLTYLDYDFRFSIQREGLEEAIKPKKSGEYPLKFGYKEFLKLSVPLVRGVVTSYLDGCVGDFDFHTDMGHLLTLSELQEVSKLAKAV
jgi:hypothetical protein